jgi:tetratricopeptide (TPR) repeat protein
MTRVRIVALVLTLGGLFTQAASAADDKWLEVKSANFVVITNGNERSARNLAWQFEQIRSAIELGWPWARVQLDRPIVVIGAKDEATMKTLVPEYWESRGGVRPDSVFTTAADRHYIAVRSDVKGDDTPGINPYRSSYWSYSLLTFDAAYERELPLWFRIGLAEILSNSIVRDDEIQFGRQIPWHVVALQQGRLRLAELITLDRNSPYYTNGSTRERFDAQAWGVMHFMLFGQEGAGADRVNTLAKLLLEGQSSTDSVAQVFGSVDALEQSYLQYQKKPITNYARLKVQQNVVSKNFAVKPVSPSDALTMRAGLHVAMNRLDDARALIGEARKAETSNASSYDVEALLFERNRQAGEARTAYAKAVELNSQNFYSHYRVAVTDVETSVNPPDGLEKQVRRAIALNDAYAPSYSLLANILLQGTQPASALEPALTAIRLDPGDSFPRLTLARVYWRLNRRAEAMGVARSGLSLARGDQERGAAKELITFMESNTK